jgi:hypothetical protein
MADICIDAGRLRADRREALIEWVKSLGVDPADVSPHVTIRTGSSQHELHLSEFVRNAAGKVLIDHARNEVVTRPKVIPIGTRRTWPDLGEGGVQ